MRSFLYFLAGVFTAILFLFGLNYFGFLFDSPTSVNVIDKVASPDGAFIATTNKASNKNGWCEIRTNVHKSVEVFDWKGEFVFNVDCGSEIEIKWEGNRNLVINYSYNDSGEVRTFRKFHSKDKEVSISYFLKQ